jgi:hypothetical protein
MKISKTTVEQNTITITYILVLVMTVLCIFSVADAVLSWDIFSEPVERVLQLAMISFGIVIASCFLLNSMINFSLIKDNIEIIAQKMKIKKGN